MDFGAAFWGLTNGWMLGKASANVGCGDAGLARWAAEVRNGVRRD